MVLAGALTSIAVLVVFWKIGPRYFRWKIVEVPIDIAVTVGLMLLFWGTFSGMMAAMSGGLIFAIVFRFMVRA